MTPEQKKEYMKAWHKAHPEKQKEYNRKYHQECKVIMSFKFREYYKAHREEILAKRKEKRRLAKEAKVRQDGHPAEGSAADE